MARRKPRHQPHIIKIGTGNASLAQGCAHGAGKRVLGALQAADSLTGWAGKGGEKLRHKGKQQVQTSTGGGGIKHGPKISAPHKPVGLDSGDFPQKPWRAWLFAQSHAGLAPNLSAICPASAAWRGARARSGRAHRRRNCDSGHPW